MLEAVRGLNPWHRPERSWALGMRMDQDKVEVSKNAKKNEVNIQPSWSNKLGQ